MAAVMKRVIVMKGDAWRHVSRDREDQRPHFIEKLQHQARLVIEICGCRGKHAWAETMAVKLRKLGRPPRAQGSQPHH